jgi:hypothetical protein
MHTKFAIAPRLAPPIVVGALFVMAMTAALALMDRCSAVHWAGHKASSGGSSSLVPSRVDHEEHVARRVRAVAGPRP